jgi:CheY-like chemotaxis protein
MSIASGMGLMTESVKRPTGHHELRVGIADDDAGSRRLLTVAVERAGHRVVCAAADGDEFLAAITAQEIDLAIVDLDMPVLDGLAVAEELFHARRVPVILVSGHSDVQEVQLGNEPVEVCLTKPIALDALRSAIEQVVGKAT